MRELVNHCLGSVLGLVWIGLALGCSLDWSQPGTALPPMVEPRFPCSAAEPSIGDGCEHLKQECEYGDHPLANCRTLYACTEGGWAEKCSLPGEQSCGTKCLEPLLSCQLLEDSGGVSQPCDDEVFLCQDLLGAGLVKQCACAQCVEASCQSAKQVTCKSSPVPVGCPAEAPNLGHGCTPEGLECTYGHVEFQSQLKRQCSQGVWREF